MSSVATLQSLEAQLANSLDLVRQLIALGKLEVTSDSPTGVVIPDSPIGVAPAESDDASFAFADYGRFYDFLRGNKLLGPKISASEFAGCDAIIKACARGGYPVSYTAYALATAYLETAATMQPIKERGGSSYFKRMYDIEGARPAKARELGNLTPGDGVRYPGRGYVQLTGKTNYKRATAELRKLGYDVDLVANPDLAMRPDVAAVVMVLGMLQGWFTGRKLSDDLPSRGPAGVSQFVASRDIINGKDRQADVASYAIDFQTALQAGGYKIAA